MATNKYTQQTPEQRHELVRQIASALGPEWTYRNPSLDGTLAHWAEIAHQDGYSLSFTSQYPTYALHILGNFPRDHHFGYQEKRPSINVDPEKTAEHIAKDIARRLLPVYLPVWNKAAEAQRQRENYASAQATLSDEILALFPAEMARRGTSYNKDDKNISFYLKDHNGYGDIEVSNDSCSLKLRSIPCAMAKEIVRLIAAKEGE